MRTFTLQDPVATLRFHDLPGAGRPLVFIHGLGCAASCDYPRVMADPAMSRRRALLLDLLGSGFSDRPTDFPYTIEAHARSVLALLDDLGLDDVDLFGHSMGGAVAISLAAMVPARFAHLVLAEPNLDNGGGQFSRAIAAFSEADYIAFGHAQNIAQALQQGNLVWAGSMAQSSALAVYRTAVSLVQGYQPDWRSLLFSLPMPRTVIFGKHSLPDPDTISLFERGIGLGFVPDAGHSMMWENPAGLALAIEQALSVGRKSPPSADYTCC